MSQATNANCNRSSDVHTNSQLKIHTLRSLTCPERISQLIGKDSGDFIPGRGGSGSNRPGGWVRAHHRPAGGCVKVLVGGPGEARRDLKRGTG